MTCVAWREYYSFPAFRIEWHRLQRVIRCAASLSERCDLSMTIRLVFRIVVVRAYVAAEAIVILTHNDEKELSQPLFHAGVGLRPIFSNLNDRSDVVMSAPDGIIGHGKDHRPT